MTTTIPDILFRIGDIADRSAMGCYLVGGFVRDQILQRPCTDIDIMVIGDPVPFAKQVREELHGKNFVLFERFRTAQLELPGPEGVYYKLELVGARKESYNPESRKPITLTGTLEDDLSRRDFTLNALALCLNRQGRGDIIDQHNGLQDLHSKILRTPLDPEQTFSDDPLRMMRAARFAAQLGFNPVSEVIEAMETMHKRITIVSRERISTEFLKIMSSPSPQSGW